MKRTLIFGILGGLLLYVIDATCSCLAHIKLPDALFGILFAVLIMCAASLAIFTMLFKASSFAQTLLRFFVFFASYTSVMLILAYTGARLYIEEKLFAPSSLSENVSGLMSLTLLSAVVISSVIAIAVFGIIKMIRARCNPQSNSNS